MVLVIAIRRNEEQDSEQSQESSRYSLTGQRQDVKEYSRSTASTGDLRRRDGTRRTSEEFSNCPGILFQEEEELR